MIHEIHIANIGTFTNPRELPTFCVDRSSGSALGNPEYVAKDVSPEEREKAIERYRQWLWSKIKRRTGREFNEIGRLARASERGEIVLLCHCYPLRCHAEIVRDAMRWYQKEVRQANGRETATTRTNA